MSDTKNKEALLCSANFSLAHGLGPLDSLETLVDMPDEREILIRFVSRSFQNIQHERKPQFVP